MQKTRKLISMLLAVMMILSMCTVGMVNAYALPEDAVINDVEGNDASSIDGELYGLMGDTDSNGTVNVKDATQIQKFAAKLISLDETSEALADVNLDSKVNVKDATAIQKWVAKFDVEEPINCLVYIPTVETEPATTSVVVVPTTAASEDEPVVTTSAQEDTKPSVPVIVVPTTAEPTEAPSTEATEPTTTEAKPTVAPTTEAKPTVAPTTEAKPTEPTTTEAKVTEAPADDVTIYFQNNWMWSNVSAHMWTANGDLTTWPGQAMTFVENDGNYDIYSIDVPADVIGIVIAGNKDTAPDELDQTPDILTWVDGQCFYMVWDSSLNEGAGGNNIDSFPYIQPTEPATTQGEVTDATETTAATEPTTVVDDGKITVYFVKPANWANAYIYGFYGVEGKTSDEEWPCAYPGEAMDFVETDKNGNDIYSKRVPADIDYIKFNDGTGTDSSVLRTNNVPNASIEDGICFQLGASAGKNKWNVTTYDYSPVEDTTAATDPIEDTTAEDTTVVEDTTSNDTTEPSSAEETTAADTQPATSEATEPKPETITIYLKASGSETDWVLNSTDRVVTMIDLDTQIDYTFTLDADGWYAEVPSTVQNVRFHRVKSGTISHTWNASARGEDVNFFITGDSTGHWENEDMSKYADVYLPGEFNGWDQGAAFFKTDDANVVTKTLELAAGTYKFKVLEGSTWLGNTGTINDTTTTSSTSGWKMTGSTGTCTLVATGGTYVFNFNTSTNKLIILYNPTVEEPTTSEATEPTTSEATEPTTSEATEPTTSEATEPTTSEATEPTTTEATEPTTSEATEPTTTEATEPTTTEATEPTTESKPTEPTGYTVYYINGAGWDTVAAYVWDASGNPLVAWPGTAMSKTGEQVNGFDVYSITFDTEYPNVIFNNNDNGAQTENLTFTTGKYYDIKSKAWYDKLSDVPAVSASATDRYLVGSFNGWNTTANEFMSADGKVGRVEMELAANTAYEFKIVREGTWTSCKDTLSITSSASGLTFSSSVSGNTKLTTKAAGTYVFEFDLSTSQLTVTYP